MKKVLYRTVLKIEVLSEERIPDGMSISEIIHEANEGDYSMSYDYSKINEPVFGKKAAQLTIKQGSDPEFFGMDENGNEIEI